METVKIYVLWFQGHPGGWLTLNEGIDQVFTNKADALNGLEKHNRKYPSEKSNMSIRCLRVGIPQKKTR